jgi:hypothetical protein
VHSMLFASRAELLPLELVRILLLVLHRRVVAVLANGTLVYEKLLHVTL